MLTRILVPLDGSLLARAALDVATHIVAPGCEITLLTSVQIPEIPIYGVSPMVMVEADRPTVDSVRSDAKRYLDAITETLQQQGFHPHVRIEVGDPAQSIIRVANELNVEMIIMSTHGRSGITRWLFGSVTSRVLSEATRPVLVVPSRGMQQQFEREAPEVYYG
jgi:nucleotide-binding universal stress UspA family protein